MNVVLYSQTMNQFQQLQQVGDSIRAIMAITALGLLQTI
jgi:hypothetical protein